jgi:hypothetical protein
MNSPSYSHLDSASISELSEQDLETIVGSGWFSKLTGFSTPSFLKDLDDDVREHIPGGWAGVIAIGATAGGCSSWTQIGGRLVCKF